MNSQQIMALSPLLWLSGGAVLVMLQISVVRRLQFTYLITLASLAGAAAVAAMEFSVAPVQATPLLLADGYARLFTVLFCLCGLVTAVVARDYLELRPGENEEFYLLLLLSTLGALTLAHASHFASLLLGLELMSVSLYALVAYPERDSLPLEAAIKYLVLSAAGSATFLFGFALLYGGLGTLDFNTIGAAARAAEEGRQMLAIAGSTLIIAGLGFKLSTVPFHMWTPDVYEGAPAPVTGFLAAVSKGAVFAALLRWWLASSLFEYHALVTAVALIAGASMLVGNLLALQQENVKRILAYSSIAHIGYLLIVLVACGASAAPALAAEAAGYYLVAYIVTTLAAFTLLGLLSKNESNKERDQLADMTGLFWRRPGLSLLFTVALLSLAGIPLTAGFIGKFYLFAVGVDSALWGLLALLVVGSAIGIFYYLRIIYRMTMPAGDEDFSGVVPSTLSARLVCYSLIAAMLVLGIVPEPLMGLLRTIL